MRNYLYSIGLSVIFFSCTPQKNISNNQIKVSKTTVKTQNTPIQTTPRPPIQHQGKYDFFKTNISNPTKNDNTISYGSIVSAEPTYYKISKEFFPAVAQNFRQKFIIVHYTALDNEKSIRVLTEKRVSAHYLVNDTDDKEIYQLVDENKRAYHAGISYWRGNQNLNDTSIGIEIVNTGYTGNTKESRVFYEFPEHQIKKIAHLIKDLTNRYQIPPTGILAHSDIAPTRKEDPGPKFPWKRLYKEYNIGMWYDDATKMKYLTISTPEEFAMNAINPVFITQYQTALANFGYNIIPNGILDNTTTRTIEALQYRYRPEKYDGIMDMETWAILQALIEKYPSK